jgi:hypothetical protein
MRVKIPSYFGTGVIVSVPDYHSFIVKLDTGKWAGKTVQVESVDCELLP